MIINFYLVVNKRGTVKAVKTRPSLDWDEISVGMNLQLPDTLFTKPQISAQITIPDKAAVPQQITADVVENVRLAIEQSTGIHVKLSIEEPDDKSKTKK